MTAPCRNRDAEYTQRRRQAMRDGNWKPQVEIGAVREHVAALREAAPLPVLAAATGVPKRTIENVMRGDRRFVRGDTAAKLLAVAPEAFGPPAPARSGPRPKPPASWAPLNMNGRRTRYWLIDNADDVLRDDQYRYVALATSRDVTDEVEALADDGLLTLLRNGLVKATPAGVALAAARRRYNQPEPAPEPVKEAA